MRTRAISVLSALMIFAGAYLLRPYTYMYNNHALQVPLVQSKQNPQLYPNDPLIQTYDTYSSTYWNAVAGFQQLSTQTTLGMLYVITVAGGLLAAGVLGRALAPGSSIAPWASAAAFGLGVRPLIGKGTITATYPEHTSLSMVFYILAVAGITGKRPWLASISFGIGVFLNQMYGLHIALYLLIFVLMSLRVGKLSQQWLFPALTGSALSIPSLIMSRGTSAALELPNEAFAQRWAHALRYAGTWHFYPLDSPASSLISVALLICAVLTVALYDREGWRRKLVFAASAAASLWIASAFMIAYLLPPSRALMLQAPRGADMFYVISFIYLISRATEYWEREDRKRDVSRIIFASITLLLFMFRLVSPMLALILISSVIVAPHLLDAALARPHQHLTTAIAVLMLLLALYSTVSSPPHRPQLFRFGASDDIRAAAAWANASTTPDATFIVCPVWNAEEHAMFRPLSRRSLLVAHKDAAAIHWRPAYLPIFLERMNALDAVADLQAGRLHDSTEIRRRWEALSDEALRAVGKRYSADFAVFRTARSTALPVVYSNARYRIVLLRDPDGEAADELPAVRGDFPVMR